jgi:LysM repeat protein
MREGPTSRLTRKFGLLFLCFIVQPLSFPVPAGAAEGFQEITVREGDTLWGIANRYLQNPQKWPEILQHNRQLSNDPTVALPGMKLRVPILLIKESLRAADLVYRLNEVRYRRKESNLWQTAEQGMKLYTDDGLRTLAQAAARVRFPTGEIISLSENSLILVRPEKGKDTVQLLSGDVRAGKARVITAAGADIDPLDPDTDYRTRIKLDKSELVLVYRGKVDVTAQGKTVRLTEGFGSEIKPLSPPTDPIPLPQVPKIYTEDVPLPTHGPMVVRSLDTEDAALVSVELPQPPEASAKGRKDRDRKAQALSAQSMIQMYRLQVSDKPDMKAPVIDRVYPTGEKLNLLRFGLPQGTYWWHIAFVDSFGLESAFSEPRRFQVDLTPPVVSVLTPTEGMEVPWEDEMITVSGQTEPGTTVVANERVAMVTSDGRFSAEVSLREGKNRILVKGQDKQGNVMTAERVVYRLAENERAKFRRTVKRAEDEEVQKSNPLAAFAFSVLTIGLILGVVVLVIA